MHFLTSPAIYYFTGTHHATYNAASLFYWNFHKENGNLESKHTELASDMTHIWGRPHNHSGLYSSNPKSHLHHYCSPGDTLRTILNLWLVWEKLCQNFRGLFLLSNQFLFLKMPFGFNQGEDGGLILRAPWSTSRGVEPAHSQHGSQGLVITLFKNQDCGLFTQFHYEKNRVGRVEWEGSSSRRFLRKWTKPQKVALWVTKSVCGFPSLQIYHDSPFHFLRVIWFSELRNRQGQISDLLLSTFPL